MAGYLDDDPRPWIPDGEYELNFLDYSTVMVFRQAKVVARFKIVTPGKYSDLVLERWYRVRRLNGSAKKRGNFTVGASSDYYRDYCRLIGRPSRKDRLSFAKLRSKIVVGTTRTVTIDRDQCDLGEVGKYSVIDKLVRLA